MRTHQIHREVAKTATARKELLAHHVDHTVVLTKEQLYEQEFWSGYADHSAQAFTWTFFGCIVSMGLGSWLETLKIRRELGQKSSSSPP